MAANDLELEFLRTYIEKNDKNERALSKARDFINHCLANGHTATELAFERFLLICEKFAYSYPRSADEAAAAIRDMFKWLSQSDLGENETPLEYLVNIANRLRSEGQVPSFAVIMRTLASLHAVAEIKRGDISTGPRASNEDTGILLGQMGGSLSAVLGGYHRFAPAYQLPCDKNSWSILNLLLSLLLPHKDGSFCVAAVGAITAQTREMFERGGCTQLEALKAVLGNGEGSKDLLTFKRVVAVIIDIAQKVVDDNPKLVDMCKTLDVHIATLGV